jgi:hypothetical protein
MNILGQAQNANGSGARLSAVVQVGQLCLAACARDLDQILLIRSTLRSTHPCPEWLSSKSAVQPHPQDLIGLRQS